jgi:hypothetical protein
MCKYLQINLIDPAEVDLELETWVTNFYLVHWAQNVNLESTTSSGRGSCATWLPWGWRPISLYCMGITCCECKESWSANSCAPMPKSERRRVTKQKPTPVWIILRYTLQKTSWGTWAHCGPY